MSNVIKLNVPLNLGLPKPEIETFVTPPTPLKKRSFLTRARWKARCRYKEVGGVLFQKIYRPARDFIYRRQARRLMGEIMALATELNRSDFNIFVNLQGHVDSFYIEVCPSGWRSGGSSDRIRVLDGYLPGYAKYGKVAPRHMKAALRALRALSALSSAHKK